MTLAAHLLLAVLAVWPTLACGYLLLLTVLSRRPHPPQGTPPVLRFDIVVPAHNEAAVIKRTVRSLRALDWPAPAFRVRVVADNCTDETAALARAAGADVIERHDPQRRGKGHALAYAFEQSLAEHGWDALVVIDADSEVTPNLLTAFAARLHAGAQAVQARHDVLDAHLSWRTRLAAIAYAAQHAVRGRGRERLGVSCGLRGNGMCFATPLLQAHPFRVFALAEDLEYGIELALAGVRVHYADEARADAEMAASAHGADTQRQRWEAGRLAALRQHLRPLLARARQGDPNCLDMVADLLTPPLGYLAPLVAGLGVLAAVLSIWVPGMIGWCVLAMVLTTALVAHVVRGWQLSGLGLRAGLDFARVPFFIAWKLWVLVRRRGNQAWIRTRRNGDPRA